jgi:IclR family pca regulon transcriptional regulator
LVDQELEEGLRSVAVPIRDASGRVAAAVNVAVNASRRSVDEVAAEVVPLLSDTARQIEADLAGAGHTPG